MDDLAFGFTATDAHWAVMTTVFEQDRTLVVTDPAGSTNSARNSSVGPADPDAVVATAGAYSWEISVPGGPSRPPGSPGSRFHPPTAARGLLRALTTAQLADTARRGEPVAVLWCSEATIYGWFGYGHATSHSTYTVDRHRAAIDPALVGAGEPLQAVMADPLASLAEVEAR